MDVRIASDGDRLLLRLRDPAGQRISLSLPTSCINMILRAMPRVAENGTVHPLDTWSMVAAENGQDLILTLRTPQGRAVSFVARPFQFEAMATVAMHSHAHPPTAKRLH